jgi:hypothetical protein
MKKILKNKPAIIAAGILGATLAMNPAYAGEGVDFYDDPCAPCAAKSTKVVNPCAGVNPCAISNPCAAKNPCAAANPCAAKNPCAAANPCAAK